MCCVDERGASCSATPRDGLVADTGMLTVCVRWPCRYLGFRLFPQFEPPGTALTFALQTSSVTLEPAQLWTSVAKSFGSGSSCAVYQQSYWCYSIHGSASLQLYGH